MVEVFSTATRVVFMLRIERSSGAQPPTPLTCVGPITVRLQRTFYRMEGQSEAVSAYLEHSPCSSNALGIRKCDVRHRDTHGGHA